MCFTPLPEYSTVLVVTQLLVQLMVVCKKANIWANVSTLLCYIDFAGSISKMSPQLAWRKVQACPYLAFLSKSKRSKLIMEMQICVARFDNQRAELIPNLLAVTQNVVNLVLF